VLEFEAWLWLRLWLGIRIRQRLWIGCRLGYCPSRRGDRCSRDRCRGSGAGSGSGLGCGWLGIGKHTGCPRGARLWLDFGAQQEQEVTCDGARGLRAQRARGPNGASVLQAAPQRLLRTEREGAVRVRRGARARRSQLSSRHVWGRQVTVTRATKEETSIDEPFPAAGDPNCKHRSHYECVTCHKLTCTRCGAEPPPSGDDRKTTGFWCAGCLQP
jgi:hypothetical protein